MRRRRNGKKGKGLGLKQENKAEKEYDEMECRSGGELDELIVAYPGTNVSFTS